MLLRRTESIIEAQTSAGPTPCLPCARRHLESRCAQQNCSLICDKVRLKASRDDFGGTGGIAKVSAKRRVVNASPKAPLNGGNVVG